MYNPTMSSKDLPSISVITPTLNSAEVLLKCLTSIRDQDYPEDKIEMIVADAGSKDKTREIAMKAGAIVIDNPLKTGEAGKAAGLKIAGNDLIALIDSDNILPDKDWFQKMVAPFIKDQETVCCEPWEFTYRREAGKIERYSALFGVNDPFVLFTGKYDKLNRLRGVWTEIKLPQTDHGDWVEVELRSDSAVPTIGANGTIFRSDFLKNQIETDYLFDIDVVMTALNKLGSLKIAKVKVGIIHTYCEGSILKFARKQKRRVLDYEFHRKERIVEWESQDMSSPLIKFVVSTITVVPLLLDSVRGYRKIPDFAWFLHPILCWITLWEYGTGKVSSLFVKSEFDRSNWKQ